MNSYLSSGFCETHTDTYYEEGRYEKSDAVYGGSGNDLDGRDRDGLDRNVWAQSGPVSWWQAENNAKDSVDSNHGTLVGGGYMEGAVGQAFSLDGVDM